MALNLEKLDALVGSLQPVSSTARFKMESRASSEISELRSVLEVLSPDVGRGDGSLVDPAGKPVSDYWFGVILAASRAFGPSSKEVLRSWSKESARYDEIGFERAWQESLKDHDQPVTIKSLKKLAAHHGWLPPPKAGRYQLLDREAIMQIPPIKWRVKGVFPEKGIGAIYGPSGTGKSFIGLGLAMSIAEGTPWFGRRTSPCPVTYVMLEGEGGLRNRVRAWEMSNQRDAPKSFTAVPQPFSFVNDNDVPDLAYALPRGGVVIVDTLNRAAPGSDENSSKDMGEIIAGMKRLQQLASGLVLVVHHTGKDVSKGLRGHSSLHAALDGAIEVKRTSEGLVWTTAKVKDGADNVVAPFKLTEVVLGKDEDGFVTSCVAEQVESRLPKRRPTGKHQRIAWETLANFEGQPVDLEEAVEKIAEELIAVEPKRRKQRAREALEGLLCSGFIRTHDGKIEREG